MVLSLVLHTHQYHTSSSSTFLYLPSRWLFSSGLLLVCMSYFITLSRFVHLAEEYKLSCGFLHTRAKTSQEFILSFPVLKAEV
jgi:hypothetical protein